MSETSTPGTDAMLGQPEYCVIKHARKLELERDEVRSELAELKRIRQEDKAAFDDLRERSHKAHEDRDKAQEMLADWENAAAHVEAEHADEVHCGCVPVLRKLLTDSRKLCTQMSQEREHNAMQALMWRSVADGLANVLAESDHHIKGITEALKAYEEAKE